MRLLLCGVGCFPWLWVSPWFSGTLAFKIRATLHCYKTNNYKFTTMFHLYTKCFLHELAIGILWLDKGDSWIYLTHGVLIDFFCSASFNIHLVKVVSIKIKMNIYAPRKENRKTKLSSAKWKINFGQNWCLSGFLFEVFFFLSALSRIIKLRISVFVRFCGAGLFMIVSSNIDNILRKGNCFC